MRHQIVLAIGLVFTLSACGNRKPPVVQEPQENWSTKSHQAKIKTYIGSRQNDSKVILDVGKVLKIWIAPYKQSRTLIAAHDTYAIVQKPNFVLGEMVPSGIRTDGPTTADDDFPFIFKDRNIESVNAEDRFKDETIKQYANNVYEAQSNSQYYDKKRKEADMKYDTTIRDYIKK